MLTRSRQWLAANSALLVSAFTFAVAGIGFVLSTLIFGHELDEEAFGEAILCIAICLATVQAAPAGINALVVRHDLAVGPPVLRAVALLGAVFATIAVGAASFIYGLGGVFLPIIAVTVFTGALAMGSLSGLQRMHSFGRTALVSQSANAGLLLAALIMLSDHGLTPWFPAALAAVAFVVVGTLAWRLVLKRAPPGGQLNRSFWLRGINFGGLAITAELMAQIERLLIPLLLGYRDLAHYAIVAAIALTPFRVLEMGAMSTLAPRLRSASNRAKRRRMLVIDLVLLAALTTAAGVVILLIGPWICNYFIPTLEFPAQVLIAVMVSGYCRVLVALSTGIASALSTPTQLRQIHLTGWLSLGVCTLGGLLLSGQGLAGIIYGVALGWLFKAVAIFLLSASRLQDHPG